MTYNILKDEVDIPHDKYFTPKPRRSSRVTRQTVKDESKHSLGLKTSDSTIDYVAASFFHSVQPYWNDLPQAVVEAESLASFKAQMTKKPLHSLFPAGSGAP